MWGELLKKFRSVDAEPVTVDGVTIDLGRPCTVLGGRNGTGKSRILRALSDELGERSVYIDLHALCELTLSILRSRTDIAGLKEEVEAMPLDGGIVEDIRRIVGRDYNQFDWYGLDIVPGEPDIEERFLWGAGQPTVPYFEARYRGADYNSTGMGLGELSTHLLFWIIQQYEQADNLVLLIDEPDAYLPPVSASALLARLLNVVKSKGLSWRLVLTTHSADIVAAAVANDAFVYLEIDEDGGIKATPSEDDAHISELLLARPEIRHVVFVEDESAFHLARALTGEMDRRVAGALSVVWGNGFGYMRGLQGHLPSARHQDIGYVLLFDGDQRPAVGVPDWQAVYLPTDGDPDRLLSSLAGSVGLLAERLGRPEAELRRLFGTLEGADPHDWVNEVAKGFDRSHTLAELASVWVELHPEDAVAFRASLEAALLRLPHRP